MKQLKSPQRILVFSLIAFLTCGLMASTRAQQQAKRPITHEDVWLMPRVGAPAVSPDGRWVVVSVVEPAYDDEGPGFRSVDRSF